MHVYTERGSSVPQNVRIRVNAEPGALPRLSILDGIVFLLGENVEATLLLLYEDGTNIVIEGKHNISIVGRASEWSIMELWRRDQKDSPALAAMPSAIQVVGDLMRHTREELLDYDSLELEHVVEIEQALAGIGMKLRTPQLQPDPLDRPEQAISLQLT